MIPPLSTEARLILWLVIGLASLVMGFILSYTETYLQYKLHQWLSGTKRKMKPPLSPPASAWLVLGVSAFVTIGIAAWVQVAPNPTVQIPRTSFGFVNVPVIVLLALITGVAGWIGLSFSRSNRWRYPLKTRLWAYGFLAIAISGLILIGITYYQQQQELSQKVVILITDLDRATATAYGVTDTLLAELTTNLEGFDEILVMTLPISISEQQGSDYARELAKKVEADLVLWGYYNTNDVNARLTVHLENMTPKSILRIVDDSEILQFQSSISDLQSFKLQQAAAGQLKSLAAFMSGYAFFGIGDYSSALTRFDWVLAQPDWAEELVNRGYLYFFRGTSYYELGQAERAITDYTEALSLIPRDANTNYNRGVAYFSLGLYEQAIADYSTAIEISPKYAAALGNRGLSYARLGNYERALEDLNAALEIHPQDPVALESRGWTYEQRGDHELAIEDYSAVLKITPGIDRVYTNRGFAYANLGNHERAIEDYDVSLEIDPKDVYTLFLRGNAYLNLENYEQAILDYDRALELDPLYSSAFENRGYVYNLLGDYERAIEDFIAAIKIEPNDARFYNNLGLAYSNNGEYELAIANYDKAVEIDPKYVRSFANRGWVYAQLGNYERAIEDYGNAIEINPQYAEVYCSRGSAYWNLGQYGPAQEDYQSCLMYCNEQTWCDTAKTALENLPQP